MIFFSKLHLHKSKIDTHKDFGGLHRKDPRGVVPRGIDGRKFSNLVLTMDWTPFPAVRRCQVRHKIMLIEEQLKRMAHKLDPEPTDQTISNKQRETAAAIRYVKISHVFSVTRNYSTASTLTLIIFSFSLFQNSELLSSLDETKLLDVRSRKDKNKKVSK